MKEITIYPEDADQRLDRFLKKHFPHIPYGLWARLVRTGKVRLDKKKVTLNERIYSGQVIMIRGTTLEPRENDPKPKIPTFTSKETQAFHSWVLYEDDHLIAINKPAGVATQGGLKVAQHVDAFLQYLNHENNADWKLVHRLDRDTSGVLLIAKNLAAARILTKAFKDGVIEKTYWALTLGVPDPEEGEIHARLSKQNFGGQELMAEDPKGDRAVTYYKILDFAYRKAAFVELSPQTGRTHQLRVHMQCIGTPILGDPKYKTDQDPIENIANKLHLHARCVVIPNLFGTGHLTITAEPNDVFLKTCDQLGFEGGY